MALTPLIPGILIVKDGSTPTSLPRNVGITTDAAGTEYVTHVPYPATLESSASLEANHVFSGVPARVYSVSASNISTGVAWLLLFDAVGVPGDGAVTPVAAVQSVSPGFAQITFGGAAAQVANGLVAVLSSTGPFVKTTSPTGFLFALLS